MVYRERETDTQARWAIKVAGTYRYHPRAQPRPHLLTVNGTTITLLFESLWPAEGPFIIPRVSLAPTRFLARVEILPPSGPQFLSTSTDNAIDKAENLYSRYIARACVTSSRLQENLLPQESSHRNITCAFVLSTLNN